MSPISVDYTRLVNQYEYGNEKYPDIDSFSEEQLEFYKELITNCYSHEIIARYCNILVQCSKDGYKFVDRAINEMQLIVIDSDLSEQRSYLSRILWLAIRYNKQEIIQYVIENLKNRIFAIIASESEIIYLPWNISQYIKAVFVKGSVGEKNDEINKIVEHCKKESKACDTSYEMTAKQIFENLIIISRKIKDEMLCCELLKAYIDYEIKIGDALMKKNEYPRAAESYEQAATTHLDMKDGSQKEKIFGEFLKSEMVKNNLPAIIVEMSEIIFTDQLGLNLRNNIAHGLCEKEDFNKNTSYIVFQMLIIITCFDWIANKGIEIQN